MNGIRQRLQARVRPTLSAAQRYDVTSLGRLEPMRTLKFALSAFNRNNDLLWASALTYTTGLSIVPILALALSVVSGFGGLEKLRPLIERYLTAHSPAITDQLLQLVGNVNARALGSVGGATLLVTVIATLGAVEQAFNAIFQVAQGRTLLRKFADYLSVTFTLPLLLVTAMTLRTTLSRALPELPGAGPAASGLMVWAGFFFLYVFFPNTRVRWSCALVGSLVASVLLQLAQWAYLHFQYGVAAYQAVYGALAAIPVLLLWLYMSWAIVLLGGEIAAALQRGGPTLSAEAPSPNFVRATALLAMLRLAERAAANRPEAVTAASLAAQLGIAAASLGPILDRLKRGGVIVESASEPLGGQAAGLFLARDSDRISIAEVLRCASGEDEAFPADDRRLAAMLEGVNRNEQELLAAVTVADLLAGTIATAKGEGKPLVGAPGG